MDRVIGIIWKLSGSLVLRKRCPNHNLWPRTVPNTSDLTHEIDMTTGLRLNHKTSSKLDPQLASQGINVP